MIETNNIYNGDTIELMSKVDDKSIDLILTSPPYLASIRQDNHKYPGAKDIIRDNQTPEKYIEWIVDIFKQYERILSDDGVIVYNLSYTTFNPSLPYQVIAEIFKQTDLMIADTVAWEKSSCVPLSGHPNRLTRKAEFVYIFVKKDNIESFKTNKIISSRSKTGQKYFKTYYNILKTKNNDGKIDGHDATFSSEMAEFFIDLYSKPFDTVLDNFMGTGTTAIACLNLNRKYIGFDLVEQYCNVAKERILNHKVKYGIYVRFIDEKGTIHIKSLYHKNYPKSGDRWYLNHDYYTIESIETELNGDTITTKFNVKKIEDETIVQ